MVFINWVFGISEYNFIDRNNWKGESISNNKTAEYSFIERNNWKSGSNSNIENVYIGSIEHPSRNGKLHSVHKVKSNNDNVYSFIEQRNQNGELHSISKVKSNNETVHNYIEQRDCKGELHSLTRVRPENKNIHSYIERRDLNGELHSFFGTPSKHITYITEETDPKRKKLWPEIQYEQHWHHHGKPYKHLNRYNNNSYYQETYDNAGYKVKERWDERYRSRPFYDRLDPIYTSGRQ